MNSTGDDGDSLGVDHSDEDETSRDETDLSLETSRLTANRVS
jgi:hypothetical protein